MTIEEAIHNVYLVLSKHRGTIDDKILNAEEQLAILQSHKIIVDEIKSGQEAKKELEAQKEVKKE